MTVQRNIGKRTSSDTDNLPPSAVVLGLDVVEVTRPEVEKLAADHKCIPLRWDAGVGGSGGDHLTIRCDSRVSANRFLDALYGTVESGCRDTFETYKLN